jgi:UDP-N-acetylmuramoylalanine--D-glutamate ligase
VTELDLAALLWPGKIVAVTGTNGKTTTVEFLSHALQMCEEKAVACGNIGKAFIEAVDEDTDVSGGWAIVEVSSFQMDGSKIFSPDHVLWTNFAADHLDVHRSMWQYFNCKANLIRHIRVPGEAANRCLVGSSVHDFCERLHVDDIHGQYTVCTAINLLPEQSPLNIGTQRENFALIQRFWQNNRLRNDLLRTAALSFKIPPHRLQRIARIVRDDGRGTRKAVEFWDDSKATNFHALDAALASFDRKVILIAGGKSKNEPLEGFLRIVDGRVKALALMGDIGENLGKLMEEVRGNKFSFHHRIFRRDAGVEAIMDEVVNYAWQLASDGDVVLLSPGFSSLDWFKSYEERGNLFEKSVLCLNSTAK